MTIYLLRHAIAAVRDEERYPDDRDRPLTGKGNSKLAKVLHSLKGLDVKPEAVFSSPFVRCHQTAQRASHLFGCPLRSVEYLKPGGRFEEIAVPLRDFDQVMVVGHEPDLGEMAGWLLTGTRGALIELKKAGVACFVGPAPGHMRLQWLTTPKISDP